MVNTAENKGSMVFSVVGAILIVVGLAVFVVRLGHEGPYAMPHGGGLYGALACILFGGLMLWGKIAHLLGIWESGGFDCTHLWFPKTDLAQKETNRLVRLIDIPSGKCCTDSNLMQSKRRISLRRLWGQQKHLLCCLN